VDISSDGLKLTGKWKEEGATSWQEDIVGIRK